MNILYFLSSVIEGYADQMLHYLTQKSLTGNLLVDLSKA